jgi:hypothetical protein
LSPAIDVGTKRFSDIRSDGSYTLSKFRRSDGIYRQLLMIKPLQLLELAGFQSF